jgi:hypothetical protein
MSCPGDLRESELCFTSPDDRWLLLKQQLSSDGGETSTSGDAIYCGVTGNGWEAKPKACGECIPTAEMGCGLIDGEQDGDGKVATGRKLWLLEIFGGRQKYRLLLSPACCWTLPTGWWDGTVSVGFVLMHCPPADTAPVLPGSRTKGNDNKFQMHCTLVTVSKLNNSISE